MQKTTLPCGSVVKHDLRGKRFGRLNVVSYAGRKKHNGCWNVVCECGTEKCVRADHLIEGATVSCGCRRDENAGYSRRTHGMTNSSEYKVWEAMIARCRNPNNKSFEDYGKRGIDVCDRWRNSFTCFIADMGMRPSSAHSIDRIDNNGNYDPSNCQWATRTQQARNTRRNRMLTLNGVTKCMSEWSLEVGICVGTIFSRLKKGWGVVDALTYPINGPRHLRKRQGRAGTLLTEGPIACKP